MTWLVDLFKKWRGIKPVYRCIRCGRELLDPDSVARGYGPDCWRTKRREALLSSLEAAKELAALVESAKEETHVGVETDPLPDPGFRMDPGTGEITKLEEERKEEETK